MDQDKPFKTIEVVDSRTKQVCKVACMSCIRGHRTTSCGIPVCRTKVFWTVKRPGRPSNSCTCRYGATGGCKCVVAKSACPHKAKKGEKRTGECRCDEQGRYCCLLEPEHWTALHALQKPVVDFFSSRELLEERQAGAYQISVPQTPTYPIASPQSTNGVPGTPISGMNNGYGGYPPLQSSSLTPRFGMMDMATPRGSMSSHHAEMLPWENGHALAAPQDVILPPVYESLQAERSSCCQQSAPQTENLHSPRDLSFSQNRNTLQDISLSQPYSNNNNHNNVSRTDSMSLPPAISSPPIYSPPAFDFSRMQAQYYANQFPNAICQNCGLSGCTCRNCPPIFQNFASTSWAQCCGRKHAMDVQPSAAAAPPAKKIVRREDFSSSSSSTTTRRGGGEGLRVQSHASNAPDYLPRQRDLGVGVYPHHGHSLQEEVLFGDGQFGETFPDLNHSRPPDDHHSGSTFDGFDLDSELLLPHTGQHLDISEFLLRDLDRSGLGQNGSQHGREGDVDRGGGGAMPLREADGGGVREVQDDGGGDGGGGGGGGGGCCCR